jgi:hypothetical protein
MSWGQIPMGFLDEIDKDSLICTFCGNKPVVAYTFAIDAEIDGGTTVARGFVKDSLVATCKEHVSILQEQFEKEVKGAEFVGEMSDDADDHA